jgi:hypothetical protein
MRRPSFVLVAISLVLLHGCTESGSPADRVSAGSSVPRERPAGSVLTTEVIDEGVSYRVVDEAVYDVPIKTQIEQHVVADGVPSAAGLKAEIERRFSEARARGGFEHHNPATNIYIYVYGSEEQARAGQGLWIGMIASGPTDTAPKSQVDEGRLAALAAPPEERFGLAEEQRRRIFREIAAAESRATDEAMRRVPDSRIMEQVELERRLTEEYKEALRRTRGLTEEQMLQIGVEGIEKGWPWS